MTEMISSVGYSVLASIIYDIGKFFKVIISNDSDEESGEKMIQLIIEKLGSDYQNLLDSSDFNAFLNNPVLKDTIENYIIYKITGDYSGSLLKVKKKNKLINENDIIEYLSNHIYENYYSKALIKPSKTVLKNFFRDFFKLTSTFLFSIMKKENMAGSYFLARRIDYVQLSISKKLEEMTEILDKTLKGEFIMLDQNYIEIKKDYQHILKTNYSKAHIYLLDTFDFSKFYVPPILTSIINNNGKSFRRKIHYNKGYKDLLSHGEKDRYAFDDWKHIFDNNNIVYVIGGAGYGKSLFLRKIINDYYEMNILNSEEYMVIYGDLKTFFKEVTKPISMLRFLQNSMIEATMMDEKKISTDMIEHLIKMGRCIILLDALDEVEKDKRNDLHKKIIGFFKNQNPNNKVCITSRSRGFIPEKDVEIIDIMPLNRVQIETYVNKIIELGKFNQEDKKAFLEQSIKLVNKGFLNSFLVLSLLINIYKAERELPENKMELYQKCFEYIANKREKEKTKENINWRLIACMMKDNTFIELAQMCFPNNSDIGKDEIITKLCQIYKSKYSSESETEVAANEFIDFCSDRTELFVPAAGEDRFKFFHRSFFEYFYSQYIFFRKRDKQDIYSSLSQFDVDSEIFELTFAMMKQKDEERYQDLIEYIFSVINNPKSDKNRRYTAFNILTLGMQVIDDKVYIEDYISLLNGKSNAFFKDIEEIQIHEVVYSIIKHNNNYLSKVRNAYEKYAQYKMLISFLDTYNNILDILVRSKNKYITETEKNQCIIDLIMMNYYEEFYTRIFEFKDIINKTMKNMTVDRINALLFSCNISKKKREEYQKKLMDYLSLDTSRREYIERIVLKASELVDIDS